jgi:hypothetical protein
MNEKSLKNSDQDFVKTNNIQSTDFMENKIDLHEESSVLASESMEIKININEEKIVINPAMTNEMQGHEIKLENSITESLDINIDKSSHVYRGVQLPM